jgi:hypothetical protein
MPHSHGWSNADVNKPTALLVTKKYNIYNLLLQYIILNNNNRWLY